MSIIRARALRKNYGENEALKGVSFDIDKGEIVGFLGPNGAGKTTTMKILTCFMAANSGDARVANHDCFNESLIVRSKIGYLPENNPLYQDMKVADYLQYRAELHDVSAELMNERLKDVMVDCGLLDKADELIGNLSKGYRQRVGLAAALVHDPEVLILDEPTVGLDPNQIIEIRNLIKRLGTKKTVILCSHLLSEVEQVCNRLIIINQGKIVASGTPAELRHSVMGHTGIRVTIRGDKKEAERILRSISGVKEVSVHSAREKDAYTYELVTVKNRDVRESITDAVYKNEMKLIEIHRETVSLQDVFNQVTKTKVLSLK